MIIERILRDDGLRGEELLGFGDGFVEIEEVRKRRRRGGGRGQRRGAAARASTPGSATGWCRPGPTWSSRSTASKRRSCTICAMADYLARVACCKSQPTTNKAMPAVEKASDVRKSTCTGLATLPAMAMGKAMSPAN